MTQKILLDLPVLFYFLGLMLFQIGKKGEEGDTHTPSFFCKGEKNG